MYREPKQVTTFACRTSYQYVHIRFELTTSDMQCRTQIWNCFNIRSVSAIGSVRWDGQWRQYVFCPCFGTIYTKGCLCDISDFIRAITKERRG